MSFWERFRKFVFDDDMNWNEINVQPNRSLKNTSRMESIGPYHVDMNCSTCKIVGSICDSCKNEFGSEISFGSVEMSVRTDVQVFDEITFDRLCVKHVRTNKFIGDIRHSPAPLGIVFHIREKEGEKPFIEYIYSHSLSSESLKTAAVLANKKILEVHQQHMIHQITMEVVENHRRALEEERRKEYERYKKEQLPLQLKRIKYHRTARCWGCDRYLSTEKDLICGSCKWIICDCGCCGCNYPW